MRSENVKTQDPKRDEGWRVQLGRVPHLRAEPTRWVREPTPTGVRFAYPARANYRFSPKWILAGLLSSLGIGLSLLASLLGFTGLGGLTRLGEWLRALVPGVLSWPVAIALLAVSGVLGYQLWRMSRDVREEVEIDDSTLMLIQRFQGVPLFMARYVRADVSPIRLATDEDRLWATGVEWETWWWVTEGTLAFDYGHAVLLFGEGLSPTEADALLQALNEVLGFRTTPAAA